LAKREKNVLHKEKETAEREANRHKDEACELQALVARLKLENKTLSGQAKKYNDLERRYKKLNSENEELKLVMDQIRKKDFDILRKLDLDDYNLTSDDLRSERNKKYKRGMDCKGHPLVPRLDFKKMYEWKEQQELEDGQEEEPEEEEEEEELLTENEKFLFKGSSLQSDNSITRRKELDKRKENVIAILNKTYAEEEKDKDTERDFSNELNDFKDDEVLFHDVAPEYEHSVNKHKFKMNQGDGSFSA
jgi:hypothetical protein